MIPEDDFLEAPAVLGLGRLGTSLAGALAECGIAVFRGSGRELIRAGSPLPRVTTLLILTVPDDAIGTVAARLAAPGRLPAGIPVLHASGALTSAELAPLAAAGHPTGSCHPFQSFPEPDGRRDAFAGITFGIEGAAEALRASRLLAGTLGGKAVEILPERKVLYHLAAALAANGVIGLLGASRDLLVDAGFGESEALDALRPLVTTAVTATWARGPEGALTGPVARGDENTLRRHRSALGAARIGRLALYEALVEEQRRLVERRRTDESKKRAAPGSESDC